MKHTRILLITILTCITYFLSAQNSPYFLSGNDPKPTGKKWVKIDDMSDEFNGTSLNTNKWKNTDPTHWKGRPPGLFTANTVSVDGGELKIKNYKFDAPVYLDGKTWTHACGMVRSKSTHTYGYYECKMKASKTFLSSTFWLINYASGSGCDRRVTELDIQECVGEVTGSQSRFGTHMISHTHHRIWQTPEGCQPNASSHKAIELSTKPYERYYVYGVWWKNKDQALFYLDGVYQYTINLPSDFNIPMFLNMVTETYDWNAAPANGGMAGSAADRTTSYQWVRAWQLEDDNGVNGSIALNNAPTSVPSQTSYTVNVQYEASQACDVLVSLWSSSGYIDFGETTVAAGTGTTNVTINLDDAPSPGTGYIWKAAIRPVGTDWQENIDTDQVNNVTVVSPQLIPNGEYAIKSKANNHYLGAPAWTDSGNNYNVITVDPGPVC